MFDDLQVTLGTTESPGYTFSACERELSNGHVNLRKNTDITFKTLVD